MVTLQVAMPIALRTDFIAAQVRAAARKTKDGPQARRLLALATIYDGGTRSEAARIGGVTLQIVRAWALRFNADGPTGLLDRKALGQPPRLDATHRAALAAQIESGPIPATHGVVRWRVIDLCQWLFEEHKVSVAKQTLSRELRKMGYSPSYRRVRVITPRRKALSTLLKKLPRPSGRDRARQGHQPVRYRGLVRRRSSASDGRQSGSEEQDH
jgi:transposase